MTNLEIGLGIALCTVVFLYLREIMKPKTEAEIQYQREKDEAKRLLHLEESQRLKSVDSEIIALPGPVVFVAVQSCYDKSGINEMSFMESSYNEVSLSLRDKTGSLKTFQINGRWGDIRKNAPFIASLLSSKIFNGKEKEENMILF